MNFEQALRELVLDEGGYTDDPNDTGNWTGGKTGVGELKGTKYGISAATYPGLDIKNLTVAQVGEIYRQDFWGPAGCDLVPDPMKYLLFSAAVQTSARREPKTAIMMLQRALGVKADGVIGPVTTLAISNADPYQLVARFQGQLLDYLNNNPTKWALYGRGWSQRVAENLMNA